MQWAIRGCSTVSRRKPSGLRNNPAFEGEAPKLNEARGSSFVFFQPMRRDGANVDPLGSPRRGARSFPERFRKKCGLVVVAAGPVVLHVGTAFDEPTDGAAYEPT